MMRSWCGSGAEQRRGQVERNAGIGGDRFGPGDHLVDLLAMDVGGGALSRNAILAVEAAAEFGVTGEDPLGGLRPAAGVAGQAEQGIDRRERVLGPSEQDLAFQSADPT